MIRLDRIYTKTGDAGDTRLVGGQKVRKDSPRIEAYGTVDELSSTLGIARTWLEAKEAPAGAAAVATVLRRVQNELFNLGSDLATLPQDRHPKQPVIREEHVAALEREIDAWNESLPALQSFVLPGGGLVAAHLHLAFVEDVGGDGLVTSEGISHPGAEPYTTRLGASSRQYDIHIVVQQLAVCDADE